MRRFFKFYSHPLEDSVEAQRKSGEKAVFLSVPGEHKEKLLRAGRAEKINIALPRLRA